jgi:hypothetical protein
MSGGDPNTPLAEAQKIQQQQRDAYIQQGKLSADIPSPGNPMPMLKSFAQMTPDEAAAALDNNPGLRAMYPGFAQKYGVDPWDKSKIPFVAAQEYNQRGAQFGLSVPVPQQLKTTQRGLGESIQTDEVTGKITPGAPALPTEKYIIGGQVRELPKAQGVGQGLTPYDSTLLGAETITPDALEQAYQVAKTKGDLSEALAGRDPVAAAKVSSYIAQRAKQDGLTGVGMAANAQTYKAQQAVIQDFTSGKSATTLNSINTAVQHMGALGPLIDALGTGDMHMVNRVSNAFSQQFGSAAPTNYAAIKEFVGGEVAKAVLPGGGGEGEREALLAPLKSANSPTQLHSAVTQIQKALAGKTEALRNQWNVGTGGTQGGFDKFLLPATRSALGESGGGHPPEIQALLDKYK